MKYQKTVRIAADDWEDGCGYTVEVVALPRGTADAVVLNIQEESGVIGEAADVFGSMACCGNGDGIGSFQPTCNIERHLFALGHHEDVASRVDFLAQILDVGAEDASGVDTGRVDDKQASLEAADAHLLERTDDGCLGPRQIAAEVTAKMICING